MNRPQQGAGHPKITTVHLQRLAVVYIRQSTGKQVRQHQESQFNQRAWCNGLKP